MTSLSVPSFEVLRPEDILSFAKTNAHYNGYELLKKLKKKNLKIVTAESMTAGLLFSTLVDIPFAGSCKYGSFCVYDTDAKKLLLSVNTNNVYSHKCVEEMASGVLKKTNATFAISISGNSMPIKDDIKKLGEVFIGLAGYNEDGSIKIETHLINLASPEWKSINTSMLSSIIRNLAIQVAFEKACKFIDTLKKNKKMISL